MSRSILILTSVLALGLSAGCDDDESPSGTDVGVSGEGGEGGAGAAGGEGGAGAAGGEGGAGAAGGEGGAGAAGGEGGAGAAGGEGGAGAAGGEGGAGGEPGDVTTAGVRCDFEGDGMQRLVYEKFDPRNADTAEIDETLAFNFAWSCSDTERTVAGNGVPNHTVAGGEFATEVSAQAVAFTFTLTPAVIDEVTQVKEPGYALNGIKFDPATAGTCPDDATDDSACNYAMGSDTWSMVATPGDTSPWRFGFGVDENDAHVQPTGAYHYHGNPVRLVDQLNPDFATSMTLVGWATDGFPIYSLYGHSDPNDAASAVAEMQSSYRTVEAPGANRPSVDDFALGHFSQDWEYVEGSGDLDECNGRFGVTPEFPNGIYHYHITTNYPTVQRCVKGTSMGGGGAGPGMRGPGGMPPPRP